MRQPVDDSPVEEPLPNLVHIRRAVWSGPKLTTRFRDRMSESRTRSDKVWHGVRVVSSNGDSARDVLWLHMTRTTRRALYPIGTRIARGGVVGGKNGKNHIPLVGLPTDRDGGQWVNCGYYSDFRNRGVARGLKREAIACALRRKLHWGVQERALNVWNDFADALFEFGGATW